MATELPIADPLEVTVRVIRALERVGAQYLVGGSLASSLHGVPRATQDIDIVVDLSPTHIPALIRELSREFFVDEQRVKTAVPRRETFNIIDRQSMIKVDVFVLGDDDLSRGQIARRVQYELPGAAGQTLFLSAPEDVVAHKLYWYRLGGGVSDRQWGDAVNVLKVQAGRLDSALLERIAAARGVSDLLGKALREAEQG